MVKLIAQSSALIFAGFAATTQAADLAILSSDAAWLVVITLIGLVGVGRRSARK